MRRIPAAGLVLLAGLSAPTLLSSSIAESFGGVGHHSFAMFDPALPTDMTGTVTEFQWTNPHAYIEMDVEDPDGETVHWSVELGSPSILMRSGWKFSDLRPGDTVTVRISPLRTGEPGGLLEYAVLADGRTLGNGPGRGPAPEAAGR